MSVMGVGRRRRRKGGTRSNALTDFDVVFLLFRKGGRDSQGWDTRTKPSPGSLGSTKGSGGTSAGGSSFRCSPGSSGLSTGMASEASWSDDGDGSSTPVMVESTRRAEVLTSGSSLKSFFFSKASHLLIHKNLSDTRPKTFQQKNELLSCQSGTTTELQLLGERVTLLQLPHGHLLS